MTDTIPRTPVIPVMKLTDVGPEAAVRYISDGEWIMQQKMDGARVMIVAEKMADGRYSFLFTNDGVHPIKFAAAVQKIDALKDHLTADLGALNIDAIILDGELIIEDGIYHAFDVLHLVQWGIQTVDFSRHRLTKRLEVLNSLSIHGSLVKHAPIAWTPEEKRAMWESINEAGVEGAVSKHLHSLYVPGSRSKDWVKHKLVKTADVIVASLDRTFKPGTSIVSHGSAALVVKIDPHDDPEPWTHKKTGRRTDAATWKALPAKKMADYDFLPRQELPVGNASLIGKDLTIEVGSVVEIEYLYWTGKAVIQPRITRKREDKPAGQCRLDQFPAYTRAVAWQR